MYVKISTQEEIYAFAKETFRELLEQSTKCILQESNQKSNSIKKEFLQAVDSVLTLGYQMQQRKEKEKVSFLELIIYPSSSFSLEKYNLTLSFTSGIQYHPVPSGEEYMVE